MADEAVVAEPVVEAPEEAPIAREEPVDLNAIETSEDEAPEAPPSEPAEPEEELEEFDWGGKKVKGPKGLKDGVLMHADYTKKTQEVASRRKELETYEQQVRQQAEASEAELEHRSQLHGLTKQLKEYENIDWKRWETEDPIAAGQGFREYQFLKEQRGEIANTLAKTQFERTEQAKRDSATRLQDTESHARKIPGWTPEQGAKLKEYALTKGITESLLVENITPQFYDILYDAMIGRQAIEKQNAAPKTPPMKPLAQVGAKQNAPVARRVEEVDDMHEYARLRKKQMAAKR